MAGLTNAQQAMLVFIVGVLATLAGWATAGFPTSRLAIGALVAAILLSAGLAIKEAFGISTSTSTSTTPTPASPAAAATKLPLPIFSLKKRLMFLELRK